MKKWIFTSVVVIVLVGACGNPLVEPTATPTSTATATSIPTATSTQPAATATQTSIPAATASPTTAPATASPTTLPAATATSTPVPPTATATQAAPANTATPVPATNTPTDGGTGGTITGQNGRTFEVSIAGGDFFARGVEDLGGGWMRIREAGNRDFCAWSNQFQMQISDGLSAQIPHCLEWRLTGNGAARLTFKPDSIGYDTSDTLKTGLAWWPSGNSGQYRITRDGKTTAWVPLTTGPEGVNFPKNGGEVVIEVVLENGFLTMPLGEIRNNVQPKF